MNGINFLASIVYTKYNHINTDKLAFMIAE